MNELEAQLHRTWVQLLADHNYRDLAAIAVDSEIKILYSDNNPYGFAISVPTSWFGKIKNDADFKKIMSRALKSVADGNIYCDYYGGEIVNTENMEIIIASN